MGSTMEGKAVEDNSKEATQLVGQNLKSLGNSPILNIKNDYNTST